MKKQLKKNKPFLFLSFLLALAFNLGVYQLLHFKSLYEIERELEYLKQSFLKDKKIAYHNQTLPTQPGQSHEKDLI